MPNIFVSSPSPWITTWQLIYSLGPSVFYACDTGPNTLPVNMSSRAYHDPLEIYTPAISTTSSSTSPTTSFTVPTTQTISTQTSSSSSFTTTTSSSPPPTPTDSHDVLSVGAEIGSIVKAIVGASALVVAIWQLVQQIQKWRRKEQVQQGLRLALVHDHGLLKYHPTYIAQASMSCFQSRIQRCSVLLRLIY